MNINYIFHTWFVQSTYIFSCVPKLSITITMTNCAVYPIYIYIYLYSKRVTTDVAVSIATTMVGAQLDYCNAILYGKANPININYNVIRTLLHYCNRHDAIWAHYTCYSYRLKIAERIEYEVALLTFKALTLCTPVYLPDQRQLCAPDRQLRSSNRKNKLLLKNPRTAF